LGNYPPVFRTSGVNNHLTGRGKDAM